MLLKMNIDRIVWDGYAPDPLLLVKPESMPRQQVGFIIEERSALLIEDTIMAPESVGDEQDTALVLIHAIHSLGGEVVRCEIHDDAGRFIWGYVVMRDHAGREKQLRVEAGLAILLSLRTGRGLFMDGELFDDLTNEGLPEPLWDADEFDGDEDSALEDAWMHEDPDNLIEDFFGDDLMDVISDDDDDDSPDGRKRFKM